MKLSIDLGGTNIRIAQVEKGNCLNKVSVPCLAQQDASTVLNQLSQLIRNMMNEQVDGIGIGVPSIVDPEKGIVYNVANISSWQYTEDTSVFDENWHKAMLLVVKTFKEQQRKQGLGPYSFTRDCDRPTDSQINNGWGAPVKPVGLIVSSFRPSDDATQYGFLIPSNMFAVVSLRQLAEIEDKVYGNKDFSGKCIALADEVDAAIRRYGTFNHPVCGRIYAFEVDGFGNALCMDDANVPSLLAAPYLGYCSFKDAIYQSTRKMIWSDNNPYFFKGKAGEGVGGPHVGLNYIWPMSIIMKAFTTDDSEEIRACLKQLRDTDGGTGFMHESFHSEDAADFTRSWFAWTNTLFGELILKTIKEYPNLLSQIL